MVAGVIVVHYNIHPQGVIGVGSTIHVHAIEGHCGDECGILHNNIIFIYHLSSCGVQFSCHLLSAFVAFLYLCPRNP